MENFGKTGVFPGGYGRIMEIPHGRIGVYRVNSQFPCLSNFFDYMYVLCISTRGYLTDCGICST